MNLWYPRHPWPLALKRSVQSPGYPIANPCGDWSQLAWRLPARCGDCLISRQISAEILRLSAFKIRLHVFNAGPLFAIFGMFVPTCGWCSRFNLKARQRNVRKALQSHTSLLSSPWPNKFNEITKVCFIQPTFHHIDAPYAMPERRQVGRLQTTGGVCLWFINWYVCKVRGLSFELTKQIPPPIIPKNLGCGGTKCLPSTQKPMSM